MTLARRNFIRVALMGSGSLAIQHTLLGAEPKFARESFKPIKYLEFGKDGRITLFSTKAELGQGTNTALRAMAAEELFVDSSVIDLIVAEPGVDMQVATGGSWGTAGWYRGARPLFAACRQLFMDAAAQSWNVSA
nr:molybdopterin-dependent oxidoreductase [Saprospiraceae bacterium]